MARQLMIISQICIYIGLMLSLQGCIIVDRDHRGHWGHRGEHYHYEHVESGPQVDIHLRN